MTGTHLCRVFTYIRSLLIEKDGCDHQNISIKFPCVCVCLSYSDLFNFWKEFSLSFPLFCVIKFFRILLSRSTPYADEIIGEYQCGFRRNRSTIDHIFSIRQIHNKDICQLFIDFEKAYDSIKRESLYDILIKFGVPKKSWLD